MNITQNKIKEASETKNGCTKKINLTSIDVMLSTKEITDLIKQLAKLKREGKTKTGYHIHLWNQEDNSKNRTEVTLLHERHSGSKHYFSSRICLKLN